MIVCTCPSICLSSKILVLTVGELFQFFSLHHFPKKKNFDVHTEEILQDVCSSCSPFGCTACCVLHSSRRRNCSGDCIFSVRLVTWKGSAATNQKSAIRQGSLSSHCTTGLPAWLLVAACFSTSTSYCYLNKRAKWQKSSCNAIFVSFAGN